MPSEKSIKQALLILLVVSFAVRAFLAGFIEFTNDEVYYWTYAKFPDWSHFDHPPMVGWVIQIFTMNLHLQHEFFIRLGAVVTGTFNTWLIYRLGKQIKDPLTGLFAAFLYTSSLYCFIISGTFIMPDTPQVTFWLLSMYLLMSALPDRELLPASRRKLLMAGVTVGLAMLSKYHSVFLVGGVFLYMVFFNRNWFRAKETYIAFAITTFFFMPVVIWNYQNEFISYRFHETRMQSADKLIHWDFFGAEFAGQFLYNGPVNGILIVLTLIALIRKRHFMDKQRLWLIILISAPLSLIILGVSFFRPTLPHWTGPAYLGYILVISAWLTDTRLKKHLLPWPLVVSLLLMISIVSAGYGQIRFGFVDLERYKVEDLTKMLTGWKELGEKFDVIAKRDIANHEMAADAPLLTFRWFPAANLDYYVGTRIHKKVYALGTLERIHKYFWINRSRGNLHRGINAYFVVDKDDFSDPVEQYGALFDSIRITDTIRTFRYSKPAREIYVYRLYHLKREISFTKLTDFTEPSDELVRYFYHNITLHPDWYQAIKERAVKDNRPVEEVMWQEARYVAEKSSKEKK